MSPGISECGFDDTSRHSGAERLAIVGPTLYLYVGFDTDLVESPPTADTVDRTSLVRKPALVDTGASVTCIDPALARELHLPISNRKSSIVGIGGGEGEVKECHVYRTQLYVPELEAWLRAPIPCTNLLLGAPLDQDELEVDFLYQPILIGRDFFQFFHLRMEYDGDGQARIISKDFQGND